MLSETRFRTSRSEGIHVLQQRGERGARELTTRRLVLREGGSAEFNAADEETVVVLQHGAGTFKADGESWKVQRSSVFTERATALYLPPGQPMRVDATSAMEAVLVSTPAPPGGVPVLQPPSKVEVNDRGRDMYTLEVHNIFVGDSYV